MKFPNASVVSPTVTPVVTATIPQDVFAVVILTILPNVKNLEMNQPNAHFVVAHILLITGAVSPTRISSNTEKLFQILIQTSEPATPLLIMPIQISPKISHRLNIFLPFPTQTHLNINQQLRRNRINLQRIISPSTSPHLLMS